jgi:hypothetical protein
LTAQQQQHQNIGTFTTFMGVSAYQPPDGGGQALSNTTQWPQNAHSAQYF